MSFLLALGAPSLLLWRTFGAVREAGLSLRACLVQAYEFGNRSAWLVISGLGFFGSVMVTIAETQARRVTGNLSVVGPAYFVLLIREFGPVITALLCAARVSAAHSAELAWMAVGEQVEALEMSAADPLAELVAPRVVAGLLALPVLTAVGTIAASATAVLTAFLAFDANGFSFVDARFVSAGDVVSALLKAALCGLYVPLASSWRGLSARGGATQVGVATTRGVVNACFGCLVADLIVDQAFLLLHR